MAVVQEGLLDAVQDGKQESPSLVTPALEPARLSLARLIIFLCFAYFFGSPFMPMFGADAATISQITIAVISGLSVVLGWAYGSSMGSAQKQADQQKLLDRVVK